MLDTGVRRDGGKHYAQEPAMTDIYFPTTKPGHVVRHDGKTILFSDGTGEVTVFESKDLADGQPQTETHKAAEAHHGVAVELSTGELVLTLGNDTERPGIAKLESPTEYGRVGNQAGSEESEITLGGYKQDKDAELERPEQISLINTKTKELTLVNLGTSYSFRSLARGPHGEGLVLGTDGALHVIDPDKATVTKSIRVVAAWEEPLKWQEARPTVFVQGHTAFITDPSTNTIHAVDIESGKINGSGSLKETPNELTASADKADPSLTRDQIRKGTAAVIVAGPVALARHRRVRHLTARHPVTTRRITANRPPLRGGEESCPTMRASKR